MADTRPNIVLVCLDSFRADFLAARGLNPAIRTPNLDRLARDGVLFENAYGEGQPTIMFRRALFTGMRSFPFNRLPETDGLWPCLPGWHKILPDQPTLAEILLDSGYVTGMASSCYHEFKPTQNFTRGFAAWEFIRGHESDPWRAGSLDLIEPDKWSRPELLNQFNRAVLTQYLFNNRDRRGPDDYIAARLFESAARFVRDNRRNQPFFLYVDSFSPHEPWDPPREFADAYDPQWDEDWLPIYSHRTDLSEKVKRRLVAQYCGDVTWVDHCLGRLLDALDVAALTDNTIIMAASDHGAEMFEHGQIDKTINQCRYRENAEILALLRFPGREQAGKRVGGFVLNHEFAPTLLGAAGVAHPPMEGASLLPLVRGETASIRDHVVTGWSSRRVRAAVRSFVHSYSCDCGSEDLNELLFDLQADPGETRDLAGARADALALCRERLCAYLGELPYRGLRQPPAYEAPCRKLARTRWPGAG